jgi:AcrR family transcriptional regulator
MQPHGTDTDRGRETSRGRRHVGRPRDERAHRLILEATTDLVLERGFEGLTIEGVARRAGVAKTTIYRWWKNKVELLAEACAQELSRAPLAEGEDLGTDLRGLIRQELAVQSSPMAAKVLPGLIARMSEDEKLRAAFQSRFPIEPGTCTIHALERSAARGEGARPEDGTLLREILAGVVFWRLHVCGLDTGEAFQDRLAEILRAGLAGGPGEGA